ncbi:scn4ab, partial [Symbiodinium microadriaticum]
WFIMYCIIFNTIIMAMEYYGQTEVYGRFLETMNTMFAMIFTLEAVIKISALKSKYFSDMWNRFDFVVVVGTNAGLIFLWISGSNIGMTVTILRTFRIARLLRLMNGAESISQLFNTLLLTLPGLGNIAALLFLLFFIYAVMGVQLFAKVEYSGDHDEHANFRDFGIAMISLLRFSTGENWDGFMYDVGRKSSTCVNDPDYDSAYCGFNDRTGCTPLNGCGSFAIYPYMLSFTVIITFVFLNLFIGVILEGFSSADESGKAVKPEDFIRFADHWSHYDPDATCYITVDQLEDFVQTLFAPLGFGEYVATEKELMGRVSRLNLHVFPGRKVHFKDVLSALSTEAIKRAALSKGGIFGLLPYAQLTLNHGWNGLEERKQNHRHAVIQQQLHMQKEYTLEHYYAVRCIEIHMLRLLVSVRRKRGASNGVKVSTPPRPSLVPDICGASISMIDTTGYADSHGAASTNEPLMGHLEHDGGVLEDMEISERANKDSRSVSPVVMGAGGSGDKSDVSDLERMVAVSGKLDDGAPENGVSTPGYIGVIRSPLEKDLESPPEEQVVSKSDLSTRRNDRNRINTSTDDIENADTPRVAVAEKKGHLAEE